MVTGETMTRKFFPNLETGGSVRFFSGSDRTMLLACIDTISGMFDRTRFPGGFGHKVFISTETFPGDDPLKSAARWSISRLEIYELGENVPLVFSGVVPRNRINRDFEDIESVKSPFSIDHIFEVTGLRDEGQFAVVEVTTDYIATR